MSRIGFDFGTTNSILSFYDEEKKALDCFRPEAGSNGYIPTVISYGKITEIGDSAKAEIGKEQVYSHFKLRLGTQFDQAMPNQKKTAYEVAKDYIQTLFAMYKDAGYEIEEVIMTVPEAWYRENGNMTTRENLLSLYRELGMPQVHFQSEPVAAAAYFCWRYQYQQVEKNPNKSPYHGKLLIVDYGGGTLDVTLCMVHQGQRIRVLDSSYGGGEMFTEGGGGCAGSAFDTEVVRLLCQEGKHSLSPQEMAAVRNEFEQKLIAKSKTCTQTMLEYFEYPEGMAEEELFTLNLLGGASVRCQHLQQAFDSVCRPALERALQSMPHTHDFSEGNFQVVLVGGFSNFCCVEAVLRELFGSRMGAVDVRFSDLLSKENRALAVAKGAALIANQKISVEPLFPYELGIVLGEADENFHYHDCFVPLIEKGADIAAYESPVYAKERVSVLSEGTAACYVRLYVGAERTIVALDESVREIFPQAEQGGEYELGLFVDANMIPTLCIRSAEGKVKESSLNQLLERIMLRKR